MADMLSSLQSPEQLAEFDLIHLEQMAEEIRQKIIKTVASNGGHLASNLGMVELTLALLAEFDFRLDKIVFDVGHQCYAWKLLTGRNDGFESIRKSGGLAGFPKTSESRYDFFNTGHSSTSISAALGLLRASERTGHSGHVIALIGDGALTGGMAFEALNDAGQTKENLIVVLNDNQMSIGRNVGGLSHHLENLRISRRYTRLKSSLEKIIKKIPLAGKCLYHLLERLKSLDRFWFRRQGVFFEQLGFRYYGPVDGHDLEGLKQHLRAIHEMNGPVLLHVLTQKGKGYSYAEEAPDVYHGVAPFVIEKGVCKPGQPACNLTFSEAFGIFMIDLARKNPKIFAISAAMTSGTGLAAFAEKFPDRFFDVGIAEQHAVTMAAGMAAGGDKPFVALYSTFLQRAYDQVLHDICLQKLPVTLMLDRAGLVGEDGETHQGIYDLSLLLPLPFVEIYCPLDAESLKIVISKASESSNPVAIRYPRSSMPDNAADYADYDPEHDLNYIRLRDGKDCTIVILGAIYESACSAADYLSDNGIACDVFAVIKAKPFDLSFLLPSIRRTGKIIIAEDGVLNGGFAQYILPDLLKIMPGLKFNQLGVQETPLNQASRFELLKSQRLDAQGIVSAVKELCLNPVD